MTYWIALALGSALLLLIPWVLYPWLAIRLAAGRDAAPGGAPGTGEHVSVVLATRDLPEQEPFAELYAAHRRFLLDQVAATGVTYLQLEDASHAMVIEQPDTLAALIGDFLGQAG